MRTPTREWNGHTWVGWLNFILLRWFFIRLAWKDEEVVLPPTPNIDFDRGSSQRRHIVGTKGYKKAIEFLSKYSQQKIKYKRLNGL